MDVYKKCNIAEQVGEAILGASIGLILTNNLFPKCSNNVEKIVLTAGAGIGGWIAGRVWAKHFYKFCDETFDTNYDEITKRL